MQNVDNWSDLDLDLIKGYDDSRPLNFKAGASDEDIYQASVPAWSPLAGSSSGTLLRQLTLPRAELGWGAAGLQPGAWEKKAMNGQQL